MRRRCRAGTRVDRPERQRLHAGDHTTILRADHTLASVGGNVCGELGATSSATTFTVVPGPAILVQSFASTRDHMCALSSAGAVSCWGLGDATLGASTPTLDACTGCLAGCTPMPQPIAQPAGHALVRLFGRGFVFGVAADGSAYTWGPGIAPLDRLTAPTRVPITQPVAEAYSGGEHACARTVAGDVLCWGNNTLGQLGRGTVDAGDPTPMLVEWP